MLGKLAGHCAGTCYFGKSSLCLLISVGLVPEITTYFLGRGPAGGRQPSAYGMRLWTAYRVSSGPEPRPTVNCDAVSLRFPPFPEMSSHFLAYGPLHNCFFGIGQ